jgi:hypothetical protein
MKKVIQTHNFVSEKAGTNVIGKVALVAGVVASAALADDPQWYTDLTTQLTTISGYVLAILGAVIGIRLAPLAWTHIKAVLYR